MRKIFILRHEKAEWSRDLDDKMRPLSEQGWHDARALACVVKQKYYLPDIVFCSPAERTRQTCEAVFEGHHRVVYDDRLYLGSTGLLYEILQSIPDQYETVMIVGHNPGLHGLVRLLSGSGDPALLCEIMAGYQPGCLSVLNSFCQQWMDLLPDSNALVDVLRGEQLY